MDAGGRLYLSRLATRIGAGAACFVGGVSGLREDGKYVTLDLDVIMPDGSPEQLTLLFTVDGFYEDLELVLRRMMPKAVGKSMN